MIAWAYPTTPLLLPNTEALLTHRGKQGWETVQVVTGPEGGLVAYMKRPVGADSSAASNAGLAAAAEAARQFEGPNA